MEKLLTCLVIILPIMLGVAWVLALILYGGKPITETPMWAWLFLK